MWESFPAAGQQESFRHNYPAEVISSFNESAEDHSSLIKGTWKTVAFIISQTEANCKGRGKKKKTYAKKQRKNASEVMF